jgi:hypothetical protein
MDAPAVDCDGRKNSAASWSVPSRRVRGTGQPEMKISGRGKCWQQRFGKHCARNFGCTNRNGGGNHGL